MNENETQSEQAQPLEIISQSALESITRAEVDVAISTAKRYPRPDMSIIKKRILAIATMDAETAESCFYSLSRRGNEGGKDIKGPSIRLAEIAVTQYGNLKFGSRVIATDDKTITAQGVCHDLETNISCAVEVKRNIVTRSGVRFGADMIAVTGNAACAISLRNAILKVVPMAVLKPIYLQCIDVAVGKGVTFIEKRSKVFEKYAKLHIKAERILAYLEKKTVEDVDADDLTELIGIGNAIREGEMKIEDAFPVPHPGLDPKPAQPAGAPAATTAPKAAEKPAEKAPEKPPVTATAPPVDTKVVPLPTPAPAAEVVDPELLEQQKAIAEEKRVAEEKKTAEKKAATPAAKKELPPFNAVAHVPELREALKKHTISVGQFSSWMKKNLMIDTFTSLDKLAAEPYGPKQIIRMLYGEKLSLNNPATVAAMKAMGGAEIVEA